MTPTERAMNEKVIQELEKYYKAKLYEVAGWVWAEACLQTKNGSDITKYQVPDFLDRMEMELNFPWAKDPDKKS